MLCQYDLYLDISYAKGLHSVSIGSLVVATSLLTSNVTYQLSFMPFHDNRAHQPVN